MIRVKKRADFERHREITDLNVVDMLIFKSRQEYQETMNCWKTEVSEVLITIWRVMRSGEGQSYREDMLGMFLDVCFALARWKPFGSRPLALKVCRDHMLTSFNRFP